MLDHDLNMFDVTRLAIIKFVYYGVVKLTKHIFEIIAAGVGQGIIYDFFQICLPDEWIFI